MIIEMPNLEQRRVDVLESLQNSIHPRPRLKMRFEGKSRIHFVAIHVSGFEVEDPDPIQALRTLQRLLLLAEGI